MLELHFHALAGQTKILPGSAITPPQASRIRQRAVTEFERHVVRLVDDIFPLERLGLGPEFRRLPRVCQARPLLLVERGRVSTHLEAGWPNTIWLGLVRLFEEFGAAVQRCKGCPERRFFVKHRRQEYCSKQCSQRARAAQWYQQHRAAVLEARHERYKKALDAGPRTKVQRRPRSGGVDGGPSQESARNSETAGEVAPGTESDDRQTFKP